MDSWFNWDVSKTFCGGCDSTRKAAGAARDGLDAGNADGPSRAMTPMESSAKNSPVEFTAQQQLRDDSPEDALHLAAATGNLYVHSVGFTLTFVILSFAMC